MTTHVHDGTGTGERVVPGGGRLTVAEDDPELVALLHQATRSLIAIDVLSDWLRDRDDARADAAADLATRGDAPDVVPGPGEEIPLVTGRWWEAVCRANGVRARVYPGTGLATLTGLWYGHNAIDDRDQFWHHFEHRLARKDRTPVRVASALHCCRGRFLFSLFRLTRSDVISLHRLQTSRGVAGVPDLLRGVPHEAGARWLRGLMHTDPKRFAAIVSDSRMASTLKWQAYAAFAAGAKSPPQPT